MRISKQEFDSVSKLNAFDRYKYALKRIADWEVVVCLSDNEENWALAEVDNFTVFPLWSAEIFASSMLKDGWEEYTIKEVGLEDFYNILDDFVIPRGYLISVFPMADKSGFVVNPSELTRDLGIEINKYL